MNTFLKIWLLQVQRILNMLHFGEQLFKIVYSDKTSSLQGADAKLGKIYYDNNNNNKWFYYKTIF